MFTFTHYAYSYAGFDFQDRTISVFLQYVDGGSVASLLSRYGKFELELARSITHQVLLGLEYLHERCIIHRDIKGANGNSLYVSIIYLPLF